AADTDIRALLERSVVIADEHDDVPGGRIDGNDREIGRSVAAEIRGHYLAAASGKRLFHGSGVLRAGDAAVERETAGIHRQQVEDAVAVEVGGNNALAADVAGWDQGLSERKLRQRRSAAEHQKQ